MLESVPHRGLNSSSVSAEILAIVLCFGDNVYQKPVIVNRSMSHTAQPFPPPLTEITPQILIQ